MSTPLSEISSVTTPMPQVTLGESLFAPLKAALERSFYKPDLQAVRIVLGAIKAHYLSLGDPAWLFVVAPPGTGKTTISIMGAAGLPEAISIGDLSENTLLSGFYGHHQPGLLERLGHTTSEGNTYITQGNGIFLIKDFTSVLSMRREKRAAILGQLREIHDGQFRRDFGTGETKLWRGRVTIIAAVTPVLDRHYSIFTVLGERFLQVRWHRPDSPEAGEWAIRQQGQEAEIQQEVREAIRYLFGSCTQVPPALPPEMQKRIASLAEIVAKGRTHVFRSGYRNREIEYVPEAEANTRISKGFAAIARGIAALNWHREVTEQDLQDALRVGLDSLPENRRRLLMAVLKDEDVQAINMPRTTRDRELEELEALGILRAGLGGIETSTLTDRTAELLSVAVLELR